MISVVIPVFRSGKYLSEAIDSVFEQTEKDWEIVLVDNNASEETREVAHRYVRQFSDRIRIFLEPKQGGAFARNRGIQEARGDYIALLDDDDMMYPERLSLQKRALKENPERSLVFSPMDIVSSDNAVVVESSKKHGNFPHFTNLSEPLKESTRLIFTDPLPSTIFFSRAMALKIGLYDTHFSPFFLEDTDFTLRMYQKGDFIEVPKPLIRFRLPSEDFLRRKRKGSVYLYRNLLNKDYFFSKVTFLLEQSGMIGDTSVRRALSVWRARWLKEISFSFLGTRNGSSQSRLLLLRSLHDNPLDVSTYKHFLRSFLSVTQRKDRYYDKQISDDDIPNEIPEVFLKSLLSGRHRCIYCDPGQG